MSSSRGSSHPGIKPRSALQVDSLLSEPPHAYSRRGLNRGEFSIELEQRSTESKPSLTEGQHHDSLFHLGGSFSSYGS